LKNARIIGTGSYLPEKVLTNAEIEKLVDTTDQWIVERTGIRQRHIAADDQFTSELAAIAARRALESASVAVEDVDMIIVATTTPDRIFPSTACLVQQRLGIRGCPAFDIQAVCSGFLYALSIADKFIRSGSAEHILVIGAETMSRIVDWTDRSTCVLFGDGAGAALVSASEDPGIISTHLHADGNYENLLTVPCGVSAGYQVLQEGKAFIQMSGKEVFKFAVNILESIVNETLGVNSLDKHAIDWLVPHQANIRIINATAKKLRLPMDKVVVTVDEHGNTSAASIPLALDAAVRDGRIQKGETILMEALGGGFTWASVLLKF
jgi:3-oxoacyl-[acyl-carrier-protein] synthase III